mmetsp:Transcript_22329/g.69076  ORF Transcript_22329/g.69076 Transcript_22329/m.69076 type:complete len:203 (+) Transcript_22329:155-763(+)
MPRRARRGRAPRGGRWRWRRATERQSWARCASSSCGPRRRCGARRMVDAGDLQALAPRGRRTMRRPQARIRRRPGPPTRPHAHHRSASRRCCRQRPPGCACAAGRQASLWPRRSIPVARHRQGRDWPHRPPGSHCRARRAPRWSVLRLPPSPRARRPWCWRPSTRSKARSPWRAAERPWGAVRGTRPRARRWAPTHGRWTPR